ncbi:Helix-turn-helix domain-containing protein [Alteromonas sp. 38]|uniref:RodZ domain-containing protein n=1 Tax=Alteromonas TaxID=226 RepID=UPI0012F09B5A|nr:MULTISPECIES: RodZ domain-containing protein [Alteromonas]CAD5265899.1 Helix-turn-helix domain-containing protein [Alteromonas sp. 154]VXC09138.1 Helix-turn-helix domain-containing protein [Alteromonas sp. 38]
MVSEQQTTEEAGLAQESTVPSPGKMLQERRESLGLTQQQIADKLFLKVSQINALEEDAVDKTTSITFTKGYVRNYAKQLGLNAEHVVAAFEQYHTSVEPPAKLQSFSRRVAKQTHDDRWMMVTYIILLLIIGGIVVWWVQQPSDEAIVEAPNLDEIKEEAANTPIPEATNHTSSGALNSANTNTATDTGSAALPQSGNGNFTSNGNSSFEPSPTNSQPNSGNTDDESLPPSAGINESNNLTALVSNSDSGEIRLGSQVTNNSSDTGSQSGAVPISMTFTFDDDCWVNIKDATGEAIAYGVKQSGRVMEIQGVPPVAVTLGKPDNVRISVNGDPVDITAFQNGQIARFSLPM